jgi:transketolase
MAHTAMAEGDRLYRFHSGAPSPEQYAAAAEELLGRARALLEAAGAGALTLAEAECPPRPQVPANAQRMVPAYSQALLEQAEAHPKLVALDGDLALDTGLLPFEERFPERFFECGIAEQDMVSQAGGMALQGLLPIVHSFACFLTPRANEQIYNNDTEHTKVIYVGSLTGLLPGGPGHSHQSVRDIAIMAANPGMLVLEPSCEQEVGPVVDYLVNTHIGSGYLRLVSIPCAIPYELPATYRLAEGRGVTLREGDDAVIIGYGPVMLPEAWKAAELLAERGLSLRVVNLPWLNRVDRDWLQETVASARAVFTIDNHYFIGGQGELVAATLAGLELPNLQVVHHFAVNEIPRCGQNDEVLRAHGLDSETLADTIAAAVRPVEVRQ